jgi:uncharacterized membrane protein
VVSAALPVFAQDKPAITGLFLTTKFPAVTIKAGEATTLDLALHNFGQPPKQMTLKVTEAAQGWKTTLLGGGQPVAAAMVAPGENQAIQLKLEPPEGTKPGTYNFVVEAAGGGEPVKLPIAITVGEELPAKLKITSNFSSIKAAAKSTFKYRLTLNNDSGRDAVMALRADAPKNFQASFAEAFGSNQITSVPVEAGKSKDVEVTVTPPTDVTAGDYDVAVSAQSQVASAEIKLTLNITGQAKVALTGEGGRLSGEAQVGEESQITLDLKNDGTEAARDVELTSSQPESWKVRFEPKQLPQLPAGQTVKVAAFVTPAPKAIAGDYQLTFRAGATGGVSSDSSNFRITVTTSTLWGVTGIAIIAIALLVVMVAVARFGRR